MIPITTIAARAAQEEAAALKSALEASEVRGAGKVVDFEDARLRRNRQNKTPLKEKVAEVLGTTHSYDNGIPVPEEVIAPQALPQEGFLARVRRFLSNPRR